MAVFLDSNIVLYAMGADARKHTIAHALLGEWPTVSTQVINECSHVLRRKQRLSPADVRLRMEALSKVVRLSEVGMNEIRAAWMLAERYGYSHFDSLILAADCTTLYSEDMQHHQVVNGRLTIINPFAAETP
jgi:predicted nucleic acid-binding protein